MLVMEKNGEFDGDFSARAEKCYISNERDFS
jgi:hypothetical protein